MAKIKHVRDIESPRGINVNEHDIWIDPRQTKYHHLSISRLILFHSFFGIVWFCRNYEYVEDPRAIFNKSTEYLWCLSEKYDMEGFIKHMERRRCI